MNRFPKELLTEKPVGPLIPINPRRPGGPWMCEKHSYIVSVMTHYVKNVSTLFSDATRTGMPWCPGTPVSPGIPEWPCWIRNDPNQILFLTLWNHLLSEAHFLLHYRNCTQNIELGSHSPVQETGSRLIPYHWPCFTRQPRSTSFPPIPLENKSQLKKTLKRFVKRIISICAHILVDVKSLFDIIKSVHISFLSVYSGNIFWQKALIRFPSPKPFFIFQLSKMIKNKKKARNLNHSVLG